MHSSLDALADQRGANLGRAGFCIALVAIVGLFVVVTLSGPTLVEAMVPGCRGNSCSVMSHLVIRAGCFALMLAGLAMVGMPRARDAALPAGWGLFPALMLLADHALLAPIERAWQTTALAQGRPTIAMGTFVRLMVVKQRAGVGL